MGWLFFIEIMKVRHTQGEWKVVIDGYDDIMMYKLTNTTGSENIEEAQANAKLIEAVPEMLEALEYYEKGIDHFYRGIDFGASILDAEAITFMNESGIKIKRAIKKATE